jgi:formylglycine-generating enzyme required for sulfatase activity/mono/diheme cytochrome c family protein
VDIPIPQSTTVQKPRRGGCLRGCLGVVALGSLAVAVAVCGTAYWLVAAPPAVSGTVREPSWAGKSEHDAFTELRRSYVAEVEPVLRTHCYACHTDASFEREIPLVVHLTGLGEELIEQHVADGVRALDLGWGLPFARGPTADVNTVADALGDIEEALVGGTMPPVSFVAAHPSGALDPADRDRVLAWVRDAQARLGLRSRTGLSDTERARNLLVDRCGGCHGAGASAPPRDVASRDELVAQGMIVPEAPEGSKLLGEIVSGRMPRNGARLTDAEIDLVRRWIGDGGERGVEPTRPLGPVEVRRVVQADLESLDRGRQRLARYVVADHLPSVRVDAFGRYEAADALATALYTASRSPELRPPVALAEGRVYRFLLSDQGWDPEVYAAVERGYPLAFDPSGEGAALSARIRDLTGAEVDVVALDWLVYAITQPPLYPVLVDLPASLDELERRLGVDRCAGAREGRAQRAGFRRSLISRNNRVVERQRDGAYWLSYDFARSDALADAIARPLGPECTGLDPAFHQDGGEVIYTLPNGWQGYALVDGQGRRLDVDAPVQIVADGTRAITNPRSCIGCHARGMLPFKDDVRAATRPGSTGFATVQALYPEPAVMAAHVASDSERFMAAKIAGGVSPLRADDPVRALASRFEASVSASEVAALLGVPEERVAAALDGPMTRKQLIDSFGLLVAHLRAGSPRPASAPLPFDDFDRVAARPDSGVFEGESGYRMVRVPVDGRAVFLGEEVTQGLWRATLNEEPPMDCLRDARLRVTGDPPIVGDALPVACVTPRDVVRFLGALSTADGLDPVYVETPDEISWREGADGYRLPTLDEWRAAAGATAFAGASSEDEVCSVGNVLARTDLAELFELVSDGRPFGCDEQPPALGLAAVGSFDVAPSGLHDLTGNVAELVWTAPRFGRLPFDAPTTALGGSWLSGPVQAASANLIQLPAGVAFPNVGLRLAKDDPSAKPGGE